MGKDGGSFPQGNTYLLTNAYDARDTESEHHLGSADFNTVIVRNANIQKKLIASRDKSKTGLYTPGTYQTLSSISGYGLDINGKLLRTYSVQTNSSRNDTLYSVLVNPCGYIGSWTEGSMESFLESVWVANQFYDYSDSSLKDDICAFYSDYYGYDLENDVSMLNSILKGSYAEN